MKRITAVAFGAFVLAAWGGEARAQTAFKELVGPVSVGPVQCDAAAKPCDLPYILWGGEAATFHGFGLQATPKPDSLFGKQGLGLKLVPGDDFPAQVRNYLAGRTPFLRGTFGMIGEASEVLKDPRTQPVVLVQMTWSRGDHLVALPGIKTVADLRGKRVALQQGGPHVSMLDDILRTAKISWSDIKVVWVKDITGPNGPAARLQGGQADAAFAVTPDMIALTGGLDKVGTGAEGTMKGARVLVSTAHMTRSIADVYAVRKDFYDANRATALKFAAAYLKGAEEVVELAKNKRDPKYRALLNYMVGTAWKGTLPNADEADGLIMDCAFVGHAGNVAFFTEKDNANGFAAFVDSTTTMAVKIGSAKAKGTIHAAAWNWAGPPFSGYLQHMGEARGQRFNAEGARADLEALTQGGGINDRIVYSFTVNFGVDQAEFKADQYKKEFDEALRLAGKYGGAILAIRGHADPTRTLADLVRAGLECKVLERRGSPGDWHYFLSGREVVLASAQHVAQAIESGKFDCSATYRPRDTFQGTRTLSHARAQAVLKSLTDYAKGKKGIRFDPSQFQAQGVGILEPLVPTPRSEADQAKNMRVEFAIIPVAAELASPADFDY